MPLDVCAKRSHTMGLFGLYKFVISVVLVAYLGFLGYLLQLPGDGARHFWRDNWNPKYGVPLKSRLDTTFYLPDACEPTWFAVKELLINEPYGLCHLLGWLAKGFIIREFWVSWLLSGSFEFIEITFRHWIPSFTECWWDHIFCDFLLTNFLGICIAMKLLDLFGLQRYNWLGQDRSRGVLYYIWPNPPRFFYTVLLCSMFTLMDVNTFLLKASMWVPVMDTINLYRMILWFFIGTVAVADFWVYVEEPGAVFSVGFVPLSAALVLVTEFGLAMKLDYPQAFEAPFPGWIVEFWSVAGPIALLYVAIVLIRFFLAPPTRKANKSKRH